jgi:von Willebrand factor type A domain
MNYQLIFKKQTLFAILPSMLLSSCALQSADKRVALESAVGQGVSAATLPAATIPLPPPDEKPKKKIKIALLLDTSNSMDGLIDQARAQLWKLVNELALAKCGNEKPELEIALYEYGNDGLPASEGHVRQVLAFTGDLDQVSEKLFSLRTNGGNEFCGHVIYSATQQLNWENNNTNLQLIFIAGNESFHQGYVSSKESCNTAKEKDIIVNTIFCGDYTGGINLGWQYGANLAGGNYMSIEQNQKTMYIETPYDAEIALLNDKLNATYVNYGSMGYEKKINQEKQDKNASSYGVANTTNRVISKTSKFYSNASWDLVDAYKTKEFDLTKIKEVDLPKELKGKTKEEKEEFIAQKSKEREGVVKQISALNIQRNAFIAEKSKTMNVAGQSLDAAMIKAIRAQAARKNFVFEI